MTTIDLFSPVVYGSEYALPLVDHLLERPHQHPSLIQYLVHRKPSLQPHIAQPDVDIRDATDSYVIEVELPGISDKKAIKLEWTSTRSLLLNATTERPFVEDAPAPSQQNGTQDGDNKLTKTGTRDRDGQAWR
jgi:hypothetical protein